jgi:hypothetical protein
LLFRFAADVFEDLVHLLERFACSFRHKEKREGEGKQTEDGEEDVRASTSVLNERRCDETLLCVSPSPWTFDECSDLL